MGTATTLYGCVFGADDDALMRQNRRRLRMLPRVDEYPALTRSMFMKPAERYGTPGLHHVQMIAFAASFKELEDDWDVWLRKLERLLRDLAWYKVELQLDFNRGALAGESSFSYRWSRDAPAGDQWQFDGGPREFGAKAARFREWIPEAESQLQERPDDLELLARLVSAHWRMGADARAADLLARLAQLDPARARAMTSTA